MIWKVYFSNGKMKFFQGEYEIVEMKAEECIEHNKWSAKIVKIELSF